MAWKKVFQNDSKSTKDQESEWVLPIGTVFMSVGLMVTALWARNNQKKKKKEEDKTRQNGQF